MTLSGGPTSQEKSPVGEEEEEISPPADIKDEKNENEKETNLDIKDNVCT